MADARNYKEIAKQLYVKCSADPIFFMMKYCNIQTKGGRELFSLYEFQKKLLSVISRKDRTIILKSRQLGITTLCACYSLWLMIFHKDQSILAVAPDVDKAKAIIEKIRFAYDELPDWLLDLADAHEVEHNKTKLSLKNGSKAQAISGMAKSARSKTSTFLIMDEAAFVENAEDLWASAQQTLADGGKCVMMSTPNSFDGFFDVKWSQAENHENDFVPVRLDWRVHPDRDQKWRNDQDKELGIKMAQQECDAIFLTSGNGYFDPEDLDFYRKFTFLPENEPKEKSGEEKDYWIFEYPRELRSYMVIVDTSRGDGADASAIQVIDVFTGDQVAEYKGTLPPKLLAKLAIKIAIDYNTALIIVENTGIGYTTVQEVVDLQYNSIFYSPKGESTDLNSYLKKAYEQDLSKMTPGFTTSTKTRPLILHALRQYVLERSIKIRSKRTYSEMKTFIWKNGKPQAQQGYNDDLLICYAIGMYLRDSALEYRAQGIEQQKAIMGAFKKSEMLPMPKGSFLKEDPFKMKIGADLEDISWVL